MDAHSFVRPAAAFALALTPTIALTGCFTTTENLRTTRVARDREVQAAPNAPAAVGSFSAEAGVVRGHVAWQSTCNAVEFDLVRDETVRTKTPVRGAGLGAVVGGLLVAGLSVYILTIADEQSTSTSGCTQDEIDRDDCTTPREAALGAGILGLIGGLTLSGVGVYVLGSDPEETVVPQGAPYRAGTRTVAAGVACGEGGVAELPVSLRLASQRVARSALNEAGDVAFAVPPGLTGELQVVVDDAPSPFGTRLKPGDLLGKLQVGPPATPPPTPSSAPNPAPVSAPAGP